MLLELILWIFLFAYFYISPMIAIFRAVAFLNGEYKTWNFFVAIIPGINWFIAMAIVVNPEEYVTDKRYRKENEYHTPEKEFSKEYLEWYKDFVVPYISIYNLIRWFERYVLKSINKRVQNPSKKF